MVSSWRSECRQQPMQWSIPHQYHQRRPSDIPITPRRPTSYIFYGQSLSSILSWFPSLEILFESTASTFKLMSADIQLREEETPLMSSLLVSTKRPIIECTLSIWEHIPMNKNNVSRPDALHKVPPTASEHSTGTLVVTEPVEEMDSRPTDTTTSSPRSARSTAESAHIPTTRPKSIQWTSRRHRMMTQMDSHWRRRLWAMMLSQSNVMRMKHVK